MTTKQLQDKPDSPPEIKWRSLVYALLPVALLVASTGYFHLDGKIGALDTKIDKQIGQVRSEIGQVRSEIGQIRSEIGQIRSEIGQIRSEIGEVKNLIIQLLARDSITAP